MLAKCYNFASKLKQNDSLNNKITFNMSTLIKFTKMHGLGNDYIYINTMQYPIANPSALSILWSKYHTGIGSDGLVLIGKSETADFSMRIFNADGSEAMMCGNASRCIGKYVYDNRLTTKKVITLETLSGIKTITVQTSDDDLVTSATVDMGEPILSNTKQVATPTGDLSSTALTAGEATFRATYVCMGNPHAVIFTEDIASIDLSHYGPQLECHPVFPQKANIEFAQLLPNGDVRMRVWERGSGITQACGTGACATAVATILRREAQSDQNPRTVNIRMDGGTLHIEWRTSDRHILMTGPAVKAFDGEILID